MKRINFIQIAVVSVILFFSSIVSFAQVAIPYGTAVIDGVIEDAWDISPSHAIDKPFQSETPTVTAYWKAMYDDQNFYVVINVEDDDHWPAWESGGNNWEYDKPEVYWDWNDDLKDGVGTFTANTGHYQFAEPFSSGMYGSVIPVSPAFVCPGGTYAYTLIGQNYVYELKVPFANFKDKDNTVITKDIAIAKAAIGFDVNINDRDEGKTTFRGRTCWANNGAVEENWNNMDGAGTIQLLKCAAPQKVSYQSVIRDASGTLVKSGNVGNRISILQGSVTGTVVYVETHRVSTNVNGLATIEVGNGTPVTGKFSSIDWSNGPYFLKTENDPLGGTSYTITGTSEILSTPYALYSEKAGIAEIAKSVNANPTNANDAVNKAYVDKLLGIIQSLKNGATDIDGNHYSSIIIGDQVWMGENLKTTKFRDGTAIPNITDGTTWAGLTTAAYCDFANNVSNGVAYGHLYNFFTVVDSKQLCPSGWHVPSSAEWTTLTDYLGGEGIAGGKLKETGITHWENTTSETTNETGFTALGGSWRGDDGAYYYYVRSGGNWWSTNEFDINNGILIRMSSLQNSATLGHGAYFGKKGGCSIRCIQGDFPTISTNAVSGITHNSAIIGGWISYDGGLPVTTRGVCWNTTGTPTITESKTTDGTGMSGFTSILTGLNEGTTYYVRAYATNSLGTAYGNQVTFTTVPTTGLVAYYPFNGNANDGSGNGNNGTVSGATLTTDRFGNSNTAYSFDGSSTYIPINNTLGNFGKNDFSISVWIKGNSFPNTLCQQAVFSKRNTGGAGNFLILGTHNNKIDLEIDEDASNYTQFYSNTTLLTNQWYHVCLIRNSYTLTVFVNGIIDRSYTSTVIHNLNSTAMAAIGSSNNDGLWTASGRIFNGIIDDIRIYNRALSPAEVSALYNAAN